MILKPATGQNKKETRNSPENFFQELDLEFLIHEMKDPISVIETGLRTLIEKKEKYGPLTPRQEKTLKRSLRNSKKARRMLYGLLEVGRAEAGCVNCIKFKPEKTTRKALSEALETSAIKIFDKFEGYQDKNEAFDFLATQGIFFHISPDTFLVEMYQDEIKFRQIVGNFLKNALYHRKKRVDIKLFVKQTVIVFEVKDDGPGIDPAYRHLVFKRYARATAPSELSRKGHGLGLAGANALAKRIGGKIDLISEKGKGATFRLTLPISLETDS